MAPSDVPEKFRKAKTDIDNYTGTGSPFDTVLANWTPSDKVAFAKWYSTDKQAQRTQSINAQKAKPAMTMQQYIDALQAVNFRDVESIFGFIGKAQIRDWEPYPQPIILGSEARIVYQLRSQLVADLEATLDLPAGTPPSDAIIEIRATAPNIKSPIQYVFTLGVLEAAPANSPTGQGISTPYRVCINPVDRSIWLVMVPHTLDSNGDRVPTPKDANTWPFLQAVANGRASFDVMQVATWKDFVTLGNQTSAVARPIFSAQALATAMRVLPKPFVPAAAAVDQTLRP